MVAIIVTNTDNTALTASFNVQDLADNGRYDIVRVIETSDDNERKYQLVGAYRDWLFEGPLPGMSGTESLVDREAPIRPYRLGVWDSTKVTPLDWDFSSGPYTGPAALALSPLVSLSSPLCGAVIRSTKTPGLFAEVRIFDLSPVEYRARYSELTPMGTRYPVIIADRREGRRVSGLVVYAPDNTESKALIDLLLPENGRIYPVWLRTNDDNKLLFHDLLLMPLDITVEPAAKNRPDRRFITIEGVEIDPRLTPGAVA
jgi:hypothetical protein